MNQSIEKSTHSRALGNAVLGLNAKEVGLYSVVEAVKDILTNKNSTGFYREISDEIERRTG